MLCSVIISRCNHLPRSNLYHVNHKHVIICCCHIIFLYKKQWLFKFIYLKVHSQGLLWQQIDLDIWNLHAFLSQVTKYHNFRARRTWKQAIIYGTQQKRNFRGNPPEYDMNRGFPLSDMQFFYNSLCNHLIFVVNPDGFNSNLKKFF